MSGMILSSVIKTTITPFQLNTQIANALAAISEAAGKLSAIALQKPSPPLYYQHLAKADDVGDCTEFIAFILEQTKASLGQLLADTRSVTLSASDRLEFARSIFKNTAFSRKDYQLHLKNISNATNSHRPACPGRTVPDVTQIMAPSQPPAPARRFRL
jgi:hypothetical protein